MNAMRRTVIILIILLALPAMAFAQAGNDLEVLEFKLNNFYSSKLRQISEEEYTNRKKESEHLRHKPYEVVSDIGEAQKMLGKRLKTFDIKEEDTDFSYREYEITFKDGTKKRLDSDYSFVAYFPQLEILLFEGGHGSDQPFDLNNSNDGVTFMDFPHRIKIGNPFDHIISPNKLFRINGFFDGQDCLLRFLEKWNKPNKKYEFINWLWGENNIYEFCYATDCFWINNNTVLFKSVCRDDYCSYYEIEFIENVSR